MLRPLVILDLNPALLTLFLLLSHVRANWLHLGSLHPLLLKQDPHSYRYKDQALRKCRNLPGLEHRQRHLCETKSDLVPTIALGAKLSVEECQYQFAWERWNCTDPVEAHWDVLGPTFRAANKETAFLQAVTAMSLVYEITKACHQGLLAECHCDRSPASFNHSVRGSKQWSFGGCSHDTKYAVQFTEKWLDPTSTPNNTAQNALRLMQLHNQRMGRKIVREKMRKKCRCHGVSGSCNIKTCWLALASADSLGDYLKYQWSRAVLVTRKAKRKLRRRNRAERRRNPIRPEQLVYIHRSPMYCLSGDGVYGTRGRVCNRTSYRTDGCQELCCGRGFNTQMVEKAKKCFCKFDFCCEVKCRVCTWTEELNTCK